jgi:hypothetical protein
LSAINAFLLKIKRKNTPLLLIVKRKTESWAQDSSIEPEDDGYREAHGGHERVGVLSS